MQQQWSPEYHRDFINAFRVIHAHFAFYIKRNPAFAGSTSIEVDLWASKRNMPGLLKGED